MAAFFTAASSQRLNNAAPPILDYQFSVAMWIYFPDNAANRTLFSLSDTATSNNYFLFRLNSGEQIELVARAGGAEATGIIGQALTIGLWNFVVARFISATSRRAHILNGDGAFASVSNATSRAPSGIDTMNLGALQTSAATTEFWDGLIGEFTLFSGDVSPSGDLAISSDYMRQLAYGGPFSVPFLVDKIVEYRSFRKYITTHADEVGENYYGAFGQQNWTDINGVTIGHHPPLPYWYQKPGQNPRVLTI